MKTIYVAILSSIFIFQSLAQTTIPGGIITDLDWTKAESPYQITGDITLDWFDDLIIEPGVEVIFQDEYLFTVHGDLLAEGTLTDSILFTIQDTTGFASGSYTGWNGLYFYQSEMGTRLKYCIVEYSKSNGVTTSDFQGPAIEDCLIRNNMGNGILAHTWCILDLTDVSIQKNKKNGIHVGSNSTLFLDGFAITESDSCGILLKHNSSTPFGNSNLNNGTISLNNKSGLWIENTDVSIDSITIENNSTTNDGGGIYSYLSDIAISNCDIINNTALINGGGIFQLSSTNNIIDTDISYNEAQGSGGYQGGGGIYIRYGSLNLTDLTFDGNTTNQAGGAIHCEAATIMADTVEINNSTAASVGGGIYSHASDNISFTNSQFSNNQSNMGGGVYTSQSSTSYFENVLFYGNKAADFGGGASFAHSTCTLLNVEFRQDTANIGGGFSIYECYSFQIDHALVANNHATDNGGGILFRDSPGTSAIFTNVTISGNTAVNGGKAIFTAVNDNLTLNNCIVWDHLSPAIAGTGSVTATYSDIEGGFTGTGNINQDPLFVDAGGGDFRLSWESPPSRSPCIDAGDPGSPLDPDGTKADMGMYYFHQDFTAISGDISDTLKCSESPYYVMGDLTILTGDQLVIEPCVHLVFMDDYRLNVEGRILALGNFSDNIYFYPSDTAIGWQGIRFLNQNTNGQDSSKLEFCKIKFSKADGPGEDAKGGGIYCNNSSELAIKNSELSYNQAEKGGGVYCDSLSHPLISSTILEYNQAILGGGIYGDSSSFQLVDCYIRYNIVSDKGGGILVRAASAPIISDNIIYDNTALSGGGIYADSSYCQVTSCFVQDNQATEKGGGIYCIGSSIPVFTSDTISNNQATEGGGIYADSSNFTLLDCYIHLNTSSDRGGGMYLFAASVPQVTGCFVDDNSALNGGGIYVDSSNCQVNSTFIQNNQATEKGGGIYCYGESSPVFTSDTLSNNQAADGGGMYALGSNLQLVNCYIDQNDATAGGGGIYFKDNSLQVLNNTRLTGNSAVNGGAVFADSCNMQVMNSTLDNNTALQNGGALYCLNAELQMDTVNLDSNHVTSYNSMGGGVYCDNDCVIDFNKIDLNNNTSQWVGGGISIQNSQGTFSEVLLFQNEAYYGGGFYCKFSTIVLDSSIVSNNTGISHGGGVFADTCNMNMKHVDFIGNSAQNDRGGGIYSRNSDLQLDSIYFENNQSFLSGGGIYALNLSSINISNSAFIQNISSNLSGGAICCNNSTYHLDSIRINNCEALRGGGLTGLNANFHLSKVSITECTANDIGGGIYVYGTSTFKGDYVLIADNSATNEGGGLYLDNTTNADLTNVTISNNSAGSDGKAIFTNSIIAVELINSIMWPQEDPEIAGSGPVFAYYSDIEGGLYPGTGNIYSEPQFTDPVIGDYSLRWDNYPYLTGIKSPCIDKGDPSSPKDPDSTRTDMGAIPFIQSFTGLAGGEIQDTLYCAESPYFVFGDITIPVGEELVIEPCVNIIFQGDYRLNVEGRLLAHGNDSTFIYFRSSDADEGWQGIRFYEQNNNGQDSSRLEYCDVRYGNANGPAEDAKGGGLYFNNSSDVSISGLNIYYCKATEKGGGIYVDSSNIRIYEGIFHWNDANYGGGIYCENSILDLNEMDFQNNGKTVNSLEGGAIYSLTCIVNISNALFDDNDTEWDGGAIVLTGNSNGIISNAIFKYCTTVNNGGAIAIYESDAEIYDSDIFLCGSYNQGGGITAAYNSNLLINDCNFTTNNANNNGGGIFVYSNTELTIYNSDLRYNWAGVDGGGIYAQIDAILKIHNSNLSWNHAYDDGGAIMIQGNSNLTMENTLITNNWADDIGGGVVSVISSSFDLLNSTISRNNDIGAGSAIYSHDYYTVKNSIIWDNSDPQLYSGAGHSYSYSNAPAGGPGMVYSNPLFIYPAGGNFNLSWTNFPINDGTKSPCINTGDPNSPQDPDTTRADMGAFYFDHYMYSPVITDILDVPEDQGGEVVITWDKSPLDHIDIAKITHYKIWRIQNWAKTPWEYIGETPAHFWDEYAYIAPTISDSSAAGIPYHTYLVSAETADPYAFYNSRVDSGYSVDNLAPVPPKGFYGYREEGYIVLTWYASDEEDFDYFGIYKTTDLNNFPEDPFATQNDTVFIDQIGKSDSLYYYVTAFDINGNESGASDTLGIQFGKSINVSVFFEGPFFISQMIPYLNLGGHIPLNQPYNHPPWNYNGTESVVQIPNSEIVDWILLEFRDATDPDSAGGSATIYRMAAFLKADGNIVGLDGVNPPRVNLEYYNNLYLVIWHRNHLGIMSALPVTESADSYTYDFTDMADKTYGAEKAVKFLNTGIWGMISADGNADGEIDNRDKNDVWWPQLYSTGYFSGDYNMDTQVNLMDKEDLWESNSGKSSFVPE